MFRELIGLLAVVAVCTAKVRVTVYYESLCPDSQAFITGQLYPAVKNDFKDEVDIKWVPFGKSTFQTAGSDVMFTCHHGPNECYGNRVHACAIEHIEANSYRNDQTKESLVLDYINCVMKAGKNFPDNIYPGERCTRELQIENTWRMISECANGTQGAVLLKQYGELTQQLKPELTNVPTVTINDKFEPDLQSRALTDFRDTVCTFMSQPRPHVCVLSRAAKGLVFTPLMAMVAFVLSKMF